MEALVTWLMTYDWWIYVATTITIATAITAALPSTVKDNPTWNIVMKVINVLAGAIANGKPADDKTVIKIADK